jgi:hypothetical protein
MGSAFHVLSGGLMLGAFMALITTSPTLRTAQITSHRVGALTASFASGKIGRGMPRSS